VTQSAPNANSNGAVSRAREGLRFALFLVKRNPLSLFGFIIFAAIVLLALVGPYLTDFDPMRPDLRMASKPPSSTHWMGTNQYGMDIFTRIVYAARVDLMIALVAVTGSVAIGTVVGMFAGYYGRALDEVTMRILDSLQAFPTIVLAIAIAAVLGRGTGNVILILIIVNFPLYARLVRSQVLYQKRAQYVDAARTVGNNDLVIMFKHLLPNCLGPVYVQGSLNIGWSVLMAASLGFIGLGVQPPNPEWGVMVHEGSRQMIFGAWWMAFFPGLFIFLFVLSANLMGDGLHDLTDPRRR
jgi:peptide/nickel transport system permease protein